MVVLLKYWTILAFKHWQSCHQHLAATWVAIFLPARVTGKFSSTHLKRVPRAAGSPYRSMINSHAPRTAQVPAGLAEAARAGPPPGLLAGSQDFIACLPPGLENCVRIKNGAHDGFRRFPQPGPWLRPDDRAHSVSAPRSSLAAAIL